MVQSNSVASASAISRWWWWWSSSGRCNNRADGGNTGVRTLALAMHLHLAACILRSSFHNSSRMRGRDWRSTAARGATQGQVCALTRTQYTRPPPHTWACMCLPCTRLIILITRSIFLVSFFSPRMLHSHSLWHDVRCDAAASHHITFTVHSLVDDVILPPSI